MLCRDDLFVKPYQFKKKTNECGDHQDKICDNLNLLRNLTTSSLQDQFETKLPNSLPYFGQSKAELNTTGISWELSELDVMLKEILKQIEKFNKSFDPAKNQRRLKRDKNIGEKIRQQAMELFADLIRKKKKSEESLCEGTWKKPKNTHK